MTCNCYEAVWPLGNQSTGSEEVERLTGGLANARLAFAWDDLFKGDKMWEIIKEELHSKWPTITFFEPTEFDNVHDDLSDDVSCKGLVEQMRELEITAAIIGVGA
ncbi:MAG: hypothetical protein FWG47_05945 [Propionibacteriaceae bacterium]|nr:hypothetical protein [Propionibacteriaceae bacterium]